jgi:hypothetical protein
VTITPVKPERVQAHLLGRGDRYLPRLDGASHHFEGIVCRGMMGLTTDGAWALFAQQIEGIDTAMSISPSNGHGAIGNMYFDIRRVSFAWRSHAFTVLSSASYDLYIRPCITADGGTNRLVVQACKLLQNLVSLGDGIV